MRLLNKIISNRYKIAEKIERSGLYDVYHGFDILYNTNNHITIKVLLNEVISSYMADIIRFQNELSIISELDHPNLIKVFDNGCFEDNHFITMERLNGITLNQFIGTNDALNIDIVINIILQICQALSCAHKKNIVHRDLSPASILISNFSSSNFNIKVFDFGLSYLREFTKIQDQKELLKILYYMSPERCNISPKQVDERSDLYSVGILFYKLMTGRLPFMGRNADSIIHQHAAKPPEKPSLFNPSIPELLDRIVLKLLEKEPTRRYQSADALISDLKKYKAGITNFSPDRKNLYNRLNSTSTLIGRRKEFDVLQDCAAQLKNRRGSVCFISGGAGIGKTRIAAEFCKNKSGVTGITIYGNASSGKNRTPYSIFVNALDVFLKKYNTYPTTRQDYIRDALLNSIGSLWGVLVQINPAMKTILEDSNPLVELDYEKNLNRFMMVISTFFRTLSKIEGSLTIFLDDLQWVGEESLHLLNHLLYSIADYPIFILGTYRNDEVNEKHPIHKIEEEAVHQKIFFRKIEIRPFSMELSNEFISNLLNEDEEDMLNLTKVIHSKTEGNPFFIIETLKQVVDEKGLVVKNNRWFVNLYKLKRINIPSNVLEIIMKRIGLLSSHSIKILSVAAIIGKEFHIDLLFDIYDTGNHEIMNIIEEAEYLNLLSRNKLDKKRISFTHDRIKEAFYKKIGVEEKRTFHYSIAKALEKRFKENSYIIFDIIYHFNASGDYEKILKYAVPAAELAGKAYAYDEAVKYYKLALNILESKNESNTDKWLKCVTGLGDIYVITGKSDTAIEMFNMSVQYSKSKYDKAHGFKQISEACYKMGDLTGCEEYTKQGLRLLGKSLHVNNFSVLLDTLKEIGIHFFHNLFPDIYFNQKKIKHKKRYDLIINFYYSLTAVYMLTSGLKSVYVSIKILNFIESKMGRSKSLAFSFIGFGLVCSSIPFFRKGLRYLKHALNIAEEFHCDWEKGKALQALGFCYDWMGDYQTSLEYNKKSVDIFKTIGDMTELNISYSSVFHCHYVMGEYDEALIANQKHYELCKRSKDNYGICIALDTKAQVLICTGEYEEAEQLLIDAISLSDRNHLWFANCAAYKDYGMLMLERGEIETAIKYLEIARGLYEKYLFMKPYTVFLYTFLAEAYLLMYLKNKSHLEKNKRRQMLRKVKTACDFALSITKAWSTHYGAALRVKAAYLALISKNKGAKKLFLQSIEHNKKLKLKYEYARSLYGYSCFLDETGEKDLAVSNSKMAYQIFKTIKSKIYIKRIEKYLGISVDASSTQRLMDRQRLTSIIKISQDISSILELDNLLNNIIQKAIEVVGAQRGYLFIQNKKNNLLEMKASKHIIKDSNIEYVDEIIKCIFNIGKSIIIEDASKDVDYLHNKQVRKYKLKSIMCIPIIYRDKKIGICYLDNPNLSNVFTTEDAEVMNVFMNQAAIAIENAELYTHSLAMASRIKLLNEEKEEQKQQLIQADKLASLGTLASSVAHDITNPNSAISANASFLSAFSPYIFQLLDEMYDSDEDLSVGNLPYPLLKEKFTQGLTGIQSSAGRIENIIGDLRQYYKKTDSNISEPVEINEVINSTISLLSYELEKNIKNISLNLGKNIPLVKGNFQHLEQVIVNIVINACHAIKERTGEDSFEGEIKIGTKYIKDQGMIEIRIEDNGIGMNDKTLKQITEPFFTTRTDKGGTGLGLNITQRLIKNHGGKLFFSSEVGKGTVTTICLSVNE